MEAQRLTAAFSPDSKTPLTRPCPRHQFGDRLSPPSPACTTPVSRPHRPARAPQSPTAAPRHRLRRGVRGTLPSWTAAPLQRLRRFSAPTRPSLPGRRGKSHRGRRRRRPEAEGFRPPRACLPELGVVGGCAIPTVSRGPPTGPASCVAEKLVRGRPAIAAAGCCSAVRCSCCSASRRWFCTRVAGSSPSKLLSSPAAAVCAGTGLAHGQGAFSAPCSSAASSPAPIARRNAPDKGIRRRVD